MLITLANKMLPKEDHTGRYGKGYSNLTNIIMQDKAHIIRDMNMHGVRKMLQKVD
jgi:hypothetical protein